MRGSTLGVVARSLERSDLVSIYGRVIVGPTLTAEREAESRGCLVRLRSQLRTLAKWRNEVGPISPAPVRPRALAADRDDLALAHASLFTRPKRHAGYTRRYLTSCLLRRASISFGDSCRQPLLRPAPVLLYRPGASGETGQTPPQVVVVVVVVNVSKSRLEAERCPCDASSSERVVLGVATAYTGRISGFHPTGQAPTRLAASTTSVSCPAIADVRRACSAHWRSASRSQHVG